MQQLRALVAIIRWDVMIELKRRESTLNMSLFAILILFVASYAMSDNRQRLDEFGPIFYWVAIFFAGTVGLARAFFVEREAGALNAILVAPIDVSVFYMAKVIATWLYVMVMATLVLAAYVVLFDFDEWDRLGRILATTAAFVLTYVSIGTLLSAMTMGLRGGEVILRLLLFPLLVPAIVVVYKANEGLFKTSELGLVAAAPWKAIAALLAMAAIYLSSCVLLFPKVVEE
jgi:heme exporter protein B